MSDDNKTAARELRELVEHVLVPQVSELRGKVEVFSTGVSGLVKDVDTVHQMLRESLRRETALADRLGGIEKSVEGIDEIVRLEVDKRFASRT